MARAAAPGAGAQRFSVVGARYLTVHRIDTRYTVFQVGLAHALLGAAPLSLVSSYFRDKLQYFHINDIETLSLSFWSLAAFSHSHLTHKT